MVTRDNVIGRLKGGAIQYEPDVERTIAFAGVRGDTVVIMGDESATPTGGAPHAGRRFHSRFSDVWQDRDGSWVLVIRQATIVGFE